MRDISFLNKTLPAELKYRGSRSWNWCCLYGWPRLLNLQLSPRYFYWKSSSLWALSTEFCVLVQCHLCRRNSTSTWNSISWHHGNQTRRSKYCRSTRYLSYWKTAASIRVYRRDSNLQHRCQDANIVNLEPLADNRVPLLEWLLEQPVQIIPWTILQDRLFRTWFIPQSSI